MALKNHVSDIAKDFDVSNKVIITMLGEVVQPA